MVFGYAWLQSGTTPIKAVVATIHPAFTDSAFSAGANWHAHTATLVSGSAGSLCVGAIDSPNFRLAIDDNKLGMLLTKSGNTINSAAAATLFILQLQDETGDCPNVEVPFYAADGTFTLTAVKLQVVAPAP